MVLPALPAMRADRNATVCVGRRTRSRGILSTLKTKNRQEHRPAGSPKEKGPMHISLHGPLGGYLLAAIVNAEIVRYGEYSEHAIGANRRDVLVRFVRYDALQGHMTVLHDNVDRRNRTPGIT